MRIIKKLYLFILKSFLPVFAMTFFIVLFIILMQFLWKNIDEMVGKGLTISLLGELFFYAALTMVPMALPLAILLASLMTFGNFGEKFELTAMKASGVSLLKSMSPLIVLIAGIAVGAYFFSNTVIPKAQVKMWTLLYSMRMKSPELEIPESVFYTQIPGYNLFVQKKDRDSGMLYNMMIYDVSKGGDNSTILLADSGRLAFTGDMTHLYLHLYEGEQFENLRDQKSMDRNVPFRREQFAEKEILIPFDANFNRLDEEGFRNQYVGKDASELRQGIDSLSNRLDSVGIIYTRELAATSFPLLSPGTRHQYSSYAGASLYEAEGPSPDMPSTYVPFAKQTEGMETVQPVKIDTVISKLPSDRLDRIFTIASSMAERDYNDLQFRSMTVETDKNNLRRHEIELLKKYTLSVACLVFFFIGAPLGAIIRKGGLGMPLVISVLLFLVYYIIDNTGLKMSRDGHWPAWFGIWLSTYVLAPLGIYITYKAMHDSSVFDADSYKLLMRKLLGLKGDRKIEVKEVILNDISILDAIKRLEKLSKDSLDFIKSHPGKQSYREYFLRGFNRKEIDTIGLELDTDIEFMTDCRNLLAVNKLTEYPVVSSLWINQPGRIKWMGLTLMYVPIIGLPVYLMGLKANNKLKEELERVITVSSSIIELLEKQ